MSQQVNGNVSQRRTTKNRQLLQHHICVPRRLRCCYILSLFIVLLMIYISREYFNTWPRIKPFIFPKAKKDETNWHRLMSARTDWKRLMSPCAKNMEWASHIPGWGEESRTSPNRSYISSMDIRKAGQFSTIWIRTKTKDGKEKNIGGDFWRAVLNGPASVAATVFDHANGSYEAIALLVEPGEYNVQIFLEYTLCEGITDPPEHWFRAGNAQGKFQPTGTIDTDDNKYYFKPLEGRRDITIQVPASNSSILIEKPCKASCGSIGIGYGRWIEDNWQPYHMPDTPKSVEILSSGKYLKRSGTLLVFGDSLAVRLAISMSNQFVCREIFSSCTHAYNWVYPIPSDNEQEAKRRNDEFDFRPYLILESIREALRRPQMLSNESLLVINLGLHYTSSINFTTYQQLIYGVINVLKTRRERLGSNAGVIWKTVSYVHKENGDNTDLFYRFFTPQRVQLFDTFAMSVMCEAGFDVLDVYPLTASYPQGTTDVVHYVDTVFRKAEIEIEKYASPKFGMNRHKVCTGG